MVDEGFGQMLDKLSKQLEKMLLLPGKFAMYLTHVFMELWPVLGGLKERNLAKKFIWKMIVFYQLSNQTTKEPNNNNKSTHNQSVLPLQQQCFRMSIQKSEWIIHIHFPIWDDILKMYLGITTTWSDLKKIKEPSFHDSSWTVRSSSRSVHTMCSRGSLLLHALAHLQRGSEAERPGREDLVTEFLLMWCNLQG